MFFPNIWVKSNVLKYFSVIFEIMAFLTHLLGDIVSRSLHFFSRQAISPIL